MLNEVVQTRATGNQNVGEHMFIIKGVLRFLTVAAIIAGMYAFSNRAIENAAAATSSSKISRTVTAGLEKGMGSQKDFFKDLAGHAAREVSSAVKSAL